MSSNIEGHWHPSKRPSRGNLLAPNSPTSSSPVDVDSTMEVTTPAPLVLDDIENTPSPKQIQSLPTDNVVSNNDVVDNEISAPTVVATNYASEASVPVATDDSLLESLHESPKSASPPHSEEPVNIKIESNPMSPNSASNFVSLNQTPIEVIDLTEEDAAANDEPITISTSDHIEHKDPKHSPFVEELSHESVIVEPDTFKSEIVDKEDSGVSDEPATLGDGLNDNGSVLEDVSESAATTFYETPTAEQVVSSDDKKSSTEEHHQHTEHVDQQLPETLNQNSAQEISEEPVEERVEESVEVLVKAPNKEIVEKPADVLVEKPVIEPVEEPTESFFEKLAESSNKESTDHSIDEENLAQIENSTIVQEESAESVFERISQRLAHQTIKSNIEESIVSAQNSSELDQKIQGESHESIKPTHETSEVVVESAAVSEPENFTTETFEPAQNASLENITMHSAEAIPAVVDLDSRPVELFSKFKSEETENEQGDDMFADDDAHDSFLNEISHPQDNNNDNGISFQSNEDDFFSNLKDDSVHNVDESTSLPNRSDKADSFAKLFEKDNEDLFAEMPSKPRARSHKRDPSFFANSSTDDPFFTSLGSQDIASDFTASTGLNTISESKADEETEKPKEPAPKADLSKSLAFLLEDDDELLPDDYIEPIKPKTATSVVSLPSATSVVPQPSATQYNNTLNRQASFANIFPGTPSAEFQPPLPAKAASTATKAPGNNAFDLPTDMVPKIVRRVGSFQNAQFPPPAGFGMQSVNTSPRPSITSKKSFFEELPPIPKKPMSRKASAINLMQQPGHLSGAGLPGAPPTGYPVGPPAGPPVSNRMPFVPPKAQPFNSSVDSSPQQYPSSSPGSAYKVPPAQVSRTSSPYNPYEPPVAPPSNPYDPSVAPPSNPYAPQNEAQVPLLPPQPPFSPKSNNQPLNISQLGSQVPPAPVPASSQYSPKFDSHVPPVPIPSQYSPKLGFQAPVMSPPNQQYMPQTSPYQSRANSSVGFHQHPSYAPPLQSTPPPVLQPAANLTSHASFGDLPSNIVPKSNPYASSGNLAGYNSNMSPTSRNDSTGSIYNGLKMSPQRPPARSNASAYSPGLPSATPAAPPVPVNNEALLRRQFPIFRWGSTGKAVCVIPPPIAFGGASTNIEIKITPVNQIVTSDPNLAKFPFGIVCPKGAQKNKKKDLEKWIEEYIGENEENGKASGTKTTRSSDRITLWKVLLALLKSGSSVTKPSKELTDSVRAILDPFVQAQDSAELNSFAPAVDFYQKGMGHLTANALGGNNGQSVNPENVNRLADYIKVGQREDALKYALDQRLWAHSLILASSLGPTQWLNTVSEFVREEIRPLPSQSARDLALMYRVFSGAGADSVSEILPGQSSFSTQGIPDGPQLDASLSNWRSLISMLFSNASPMNLETAKKLSSLLLKSGFVEGAHLCHVLLGTCVFGAPDGSFEVFGADSSLESGVGRDVDSVLLSLVLEYYKLSVEAVPTVTSFPHLILYKLNLVSYLIDRGNISEAQVLFDNTTGIVKSSKNVPYASGLYDYIDVLAQRLNLTPQGDSSSGWLSSKLGKPKLDKMLGHLDKSFSKFVAGDDNSNTKEQDGIFKRLAETPMTSRAQSVVYLPNHPYAAPPTRSNPYDPPLSVNTLDGDNSPGSVSSRAQSTVGLNQMLSPQDSQSRPFSPYTPPSSQAKYSNHASSVNDYSEAPGSSAMPLSRPPSSIHEVSASSLPLRQNSANPYSAVSAGSNPYAPSPDASSGNPYAPSNDVSSGNFYASRSDTSSPAASAQPFGSPSKSMSRNNSFPSVAEQEEPASDFSNPYSPSNAYAPASSAGYNPYAPSSAADVSGKSSEESRHEHSSSIGDLHVPPSTGNFNPYSAYGYDPNEPATPEAPGQEQPSEDTENTKNDYESGSEPAPEPYQSPEYGYSNNDDEVKNSPHIYGHSYKPSDSIISPMGVPTFGSQTFATPSEDYQHSTNHNNSYEDDEIEDLGFANNSFKKKEEPAAEEEKKKEEKKVEEKPKKGWFSWMRKGGDGDSPKPVQIKLGQEMSLVYDPVLKRYVNKNAPKEELKPVAATPPPPPPSHSSPSSHSGLSSPPSTSMPPFSGGPPSFGSRPGSAAPPSSSSPSASGGMPPTLASTKSSPAIPVSGGLDDLLAVAPTAGRKSARRNARNRYVDVMSQQQQQQQ